MLEPAPDSFAVPPRFPHGDGHLSPRAVSNLYLAKTKSSSERTSCMKVRLSTAPLLPCTGIIEQPQSVEDFV